MSKNVITNRIVLGILSEFKNDFKFGDESESKVFEKIINYLVFSKIDPDAFSDSCIFDLVDMDKNSTFGIDAFAVFINDNLITDKESILEYQKTKRMDIKFVFIQTKRSTSFDSGEFLKFTTAVGNFLSNNPSIDLSDELKESKEIIDELFKPENARIFANKRPKCELYFAISGNKTTEESIAGLITEEERKLKTMNREFDSFLIKLIDSDYVIDSYAEIENRHTVSIVFEKNIPCGQIDDVEQSFIGYLPIGEFLKLITGSDGNIRKNLFYENVRDFQGQSNTVNSEISETLIDQEKIDKFLLLNNGITIVTKEFRNIRSNEYEICDYSIVNGCQTSNVLYQNADLIRSSNKLYIPVKIVHTTNNNVITSLIRSTNRQTPVPDEAFVSLEKFHKRLQDYYKMYSQSCFEALYYERRSKEFSNPTDRIEKPRIVNLHGQIRSFISIIVGEPQLAMSNNPTSILKEHKQKIFQDDHVYAPYFLSSLLLYIFYIKTENEKISKKYVISRYWICWIVRVILFNRLEIGHMNSEKTAQRCEKVIEQLNNDQIVMKTFRDAISLFEEAKANHRNAHGRERNAQLVRLKTFRDEVKQKLLNKLTSTSTTDAVTARDS